ncbi:MAG: heme-binding protein [Steroidobacteraceae bacterium]
MFATAWAAGPFNDQPASPRSLPGDNLPPFGMLDEQGKLIPTPSIPAELLKRDANTPPESTAPGPDLSLAMEAARAAVDACMKSGYRVGATVVDSVGDARAMLTADGSDGSHVFVAQRKAIVAVTFKMTSSQAYAALLADPSLLPKVKPNMFVEGGAVPILSKGQLLGAIGVSGAAGAVIGKQDEICAQAALDKIRSKLK